MKKLRKILVVGQTPPPFGGQAVMIQNLVEADFTSIKILHVRMAFAKEMNDLGRMRFGKLIEAVSIVFRVIYFRLRHNANILYFPPSGPSMLPMLRDIAILGSVRWMFKKTIFHFHASGLSEIYPQLPWYLKFLFHMTYFKPDVSIQLSEFSPDDGGFLKAKHKYYIPNGIADDAIGLVKPLKKNGEAFNILFVGLIIESKGVLLLLEAIHILKERGFYFHLTLVGKISSDEFEFQIREYIQKYDISSQVSFKGVLTGKDKFQEYLNADVFCFPTFFESESFPLVVVEAMSFSLPIVVSRWRGVQSLIWEGENGYGISPHDVNAMVERLITLFENPDERVLMGERGRKIFLETLTFDKFRSRMEECFLKN